MDHQAIRNYVRPDQVFGPNDASLIEVEDREALRQLFDPQNKIYEALKARPSIILGRRGTGKTAYLHDVFLSDDYRIAREIKTSKTFAQIVTAIEKGTPHYIPTEEIAGLWEELIVLSVMAQVANTFQDTSREMRLLADYLARDHQGESEGLDSFLWKIVNGLAAKDATQGLIGAVSRVVKEATGITFANARQLTDRILEDNRAKAIVLLDSLEQYPTDIPSVANALAGLLKCAGQFNQRNRHVHLRLCLPAELYHVFMDHVSTNPLKDLLPPQRLLLHWIAGELLSVAAHRLALYLQLYHEDLAPEALDLGDRLEVRRFMQRFFPPTVTNLLGQTEDTFSYLFRHTQLQPRHLLGYLNAIFEVERKSKRGIHPRVSEEAVRTGIAEQEHLLCGEVCSGFKLVYPHARAVCEACIPELPLTFGHAALHRLFVRRGKKASGLSDFWDFRRLLIEMGIVGRVVGANSRYVVGRFEYTVPHKLIVSTEDTLCLHPVFATVHRYKQVAGQKPIYPYGSDLDGEDHRDWSR
jgi:hypothetical protein